MVKKKNPTRRAGRGKALFGAGDELRSLDEDPWELDPTFDLVVGAYGGYALNTFFFEQLFAAAADRLCAKIGPWVGDIAKQIPMSTSSRDLLVSACQESPRLRRRLRAIAHRGHVPRVTLADIRRHVGEMGLASEAFVNQNRLLIDQDNILEVLRIRAQLPGPRRQPAVVG